MREWKTEILSSDEVLGTKTCLKEEKGKTPRSSSKKMKALAKKESERMVSTLSWKGLRTNVVTKERLVSGNGRKGPMAKPTSEAIVGILRWYLHTRCAPSAEMTCSRRSPEQIAMLPSGIINSNDQECFS